MATQRPVCRYCGGHRLWRSLLEGIRRIFSLRRREDRLMYIPVDRIDPNPFQPREYFLEEPHENLKKSIETYGVIVPIIVNRKGRRYTLVAGQRRLKAAREVGYRYIPAIVRSLSPHQVMEVSTLENLHREDLSTLDVVKMFDRIRRRYPQIGEGEMAEALGLEVDRLRHARSLLDLPVPVLEALRAKMIGEEHARLVAQIPDPDAQLEVIEIIYNEKLGLEETQELVDRVTGKEPSYVTADQATHYHAPSCPFALLIPEERKLKFYSRREAARRGKIPCMQCL